jgi:hypothetical protein
VWYNSRDMATETIHAPTPPVGVIESISRGFETVAGHLALVLLPLLLDLVLWVGPRISIQQYYQDVMLPTVEASDPNAREMWPEELRDSQYFPIVAPSLLPVLNFMTGPEAASLPFEYQPPVWSLDNVVSLLGVNILSLVLGITVTALYLGIIGAHMGGTAGIGEMLLRLPINIAQLGILCIIVPILGLILLAPFLLVAGGLMYANSGVLAASVMIIGFVVCMWFGLFGVFTLHGMFANRRNLLGALWDSIRVVQWNMSSTLFLMIVVSVIYWGAVIIWVMAGLDSWLMLLAFAGHAFVLTALITATFIFYQDRYRYWREMREALLAELQRRRTQDRTQL